MSTGNPLLMVQSVLAAKAETAAGVAESLTASDAAFNVFNVNLEEDIGENEREGQGTSMDPLPSVAGARSGRLTFSLYAHGKGSAAIPEWALAFLPACGMVATSQTYGWASGSASAVTLTMAVYEDGLKRGICGAMGTWTATFNSGQPVLFEFEFLGKLIDEADVALITPSFPSVLPPVFSGATVSLGSFTPTLSQIVLRAGNELALREDATDATAYKSAVIVSRKPSGTMDPEATLVATQSWMTKLTASTQEALVIDVGATANNIIQIDAPKCQVVKKARGNRNKIMTNQLDLKFPRSAAAGDDSLTITFA